MRKNRFKIIIFLAVIISFNIIAMEEGGKKTSFVVINGFKTSPEFINGNKIFFNIRIRVATGLTGFSQEKIEEILNQQAGEMQKVFLPPNVADVSNQPAFIYHYDAGEKDKENNSVTIIVAADVRDKSSEDPDANILKKIIFSKDYQLEEASTINSSQLMKIVINNLTKDDINCCIFFDEKEAYYKPGNAITFCDLSDNFHASKQKQEVKFFVKNSFKSFDKLSFDKIYFNFRVRILKGYRSFTSEQLDEKASSIRKVHLPAVVDETSTELACIYNNPEKEKLEKDQYIIIVTADYFMEENVKRFFFFSKTFSVDEKPLDGKPLKVLEVRINDIARGADLRESEVKFSIHAHSENVNHSANSRQYGF